MFSNSLDRTAPPCVLVIFGIAGDLTKRLLYPAICNLGSKGKLDKNFCIIGIARKHETTEAFRQYFIAETQVFITEPKAKKYSESLIDRMEYISGDFKNLQTYQALKQTLTENNILNKVQNYLFYFATPPELIEDIAAGLSQAKLLEEKNRFFRRIIVEKPFGRDLTSAIALNKKLLTLMHEPQIFCIDHFLGKETVQNLLALRFSNSIFELLWHRDYIDHIQITVAETLGVELRGAFYDVTGALRDMVPNHLFQLLSLITMESPQSFDDNSIRAEKAKVLQAVVKMRPEEVPHSVIRGQYSSGEINGVKVPNYNAEKNVNPHSTIETYIALKLFLNNTRWQGVPFYLRTGKRLPAHTSEIIIQFKSCTSHLFTKADQTLLPNILRINLQPNEGILLNFNAKTPGIQQKLTPVEMKFSYKDYFKIQPQTGYETILYDCMRGNQLLFNQTEMVETGWYLVQPILTYWQTLANENCPFYTAGSWGPPEAEKLLAKDGRKWLL